MIKATIINSSILTELNNALTEISTQLNHFSKETNQSTIELCENIKAQLQCLILTNELHKSQSGKPTKIPLHNLIKDYDVTQFSATKNLLEIATKNLPSPRGDNYF